MENFNQNKYIQEWKKQNKIRLVVELDKSYQDSINSIKDNFSLAEFMRRAIALYEEQPNLYNKDTKENED